MLIQACQKPQHQREAEYAGLDQQLHIVVMRFIYDLICIEAAVTGINRSEGSHPPASNRSLGKHSQTIFHDIQTDAGAKISEASQHLPLSYENQQTQDKNTHGD